MWKCFEPAWMEYLHGIEIWNRKTDGWAPSQPALQLIDGSGVTPFAGIDFHSRKHLFPLAMELPGDFQSNERYLVERLRDPASHATFRNRLLSDSLVGWRHLRLRMAETCRRTAARTYRSIIPRRSASALSRRVQN